MLKKWREVDIAISQLPHKPMKAAMGRSLRKDAPELFKAVEKLQCSQRDRPLREGAFVKRGTRRGHRRCAAVGVA